MWRFWDDTPLKNFALDVVLADEAAVPDRDLLTDAAERVAAPRSSWPPWPGPTRKPRHDPELLAAAYDRIFRMHGRIGPWQ
ncbi:uridine diphosphate-N-acetylglucosamine-binding protein YvcK [Streptomyces hirsutus]